MCGIAGILTRGRDPQELRGAIARMTDALAHRGPDDSGVEYLEIPGGFQIALGHRRLSILDLSPRGRQPMCEPGSRSWIVYNGEVYNHMDLRKRLGHVPFRSTCDTETLLQGWVEQGPEWIRHLRGMFGLALYDGRRRQLWLARGPMGIKPLYAAQPEPDLWLFASEVRAILASGLVPRKISRPGLSSYLAFGAFQAPWTIVDGVQSVLVSERWCFDLDGAAPWTPVRECYWRAGTPEAGKPYRRDELAVGAADLERLSTVWEDAVAGQMLADVPVGVFLSGGIDSSAIVATLARLGKPVKTFSVVFRERAFDESWHARAVASACHSEHTEVAVSPTDVLSHLDQILMAYDQPSIDGINTYTISKAVRDAGIKVALSGLGGDEVFAGYSTFVRMVRLEKWRGYSNEALRRLLSVLTRPFVRASGKWGKALQLISASRSRLDAYCILRQLYSATMRSRLIQGVPGRDPELEQTLAEDLAERADSTDVVNGVSLLETSLYMHNMLLRDTDQMSMAHGLEVRVPLLDHVLIDELARLPGLIRLPGKGQPNKWLLVKLAGRLLPPEVVRRPKMGFEFPWRQWLRQELKSQVEEILLEAGAVEQAGLRPATVADVWREFLAGRQGFRPSDILALVHLVFWVQANNVRSP